MSDGAYTFRLASAADLTLLRRWLHSPEVVRWWGDPAEQAAILENDLREPLMVMRIVSVEGRPFAYAQDYDVHSWPQPQFAGLPAGARAIDAFIGEPAMLGVGHGSGFLRALTALLCEEGATAVAIDPAMSNLRARRAFEKAGFSGNEVFQTESGPAVLMTAIVPVKQPFASSVLR